MSEIIWTPSLDRKNASHLAAFMAHLGYQGLGEDVQKLYEWSLQENDSFWKEVWRYTGISASKPYEAVRAAPPPGQKIPRGTWFPGAELNFAEHLLRRNDGHRAIIFWGEDRVRRELSFAELRSLVGKAASFLKSQGVGKGDRVAAVLPNLPETVIAMLATTSLGAIWSSCSPDFGAPAILDRFSQIEPKVLFTVDGYYFKGQTLSTRSTTDAVLNGLPTVKSLVEVRYVNANGSPGLRSYTSWKEIEASEPAELTFVPTPFDHPLYIMFSSGTTGKPKCIVHSAGGVLLEHLKELVLHTNLKPEDRIFYQTTCGWMMWNWLVSSLAAGATIVLYDGAPFHHAGNILFELSEKEHVTIFGTNAKFLSACEKEGLRPGSSHNLSGIHTILSTGSPLAPESFDYVYNELNRDVCLASISGGTDIIGCFALGCPLLPVRRGELQMRSLGLAVEVFTPAGQSVVGERGELVCTNAFPSMPLGFWNDPDDRRYEKAYFSRFPGVWTHGDFVELTPHGGMVFTGRSDAVLNPGGIRIGTAEIYRQVETIPAVAESLAVGQEWDGDVRVVLFVKLTSGATLDDSLREQIRTVIRKNTSPFHVPKKIISVPDLPRTRNGKLAEIAVRDIIHGKEIENREALANPESLEAFKNLTELRR